MKVRKYIQTVEVGTHDSWYRELAVSETVKNAGIVNLYRDEANKDDVDFWRGIYHSPRMGDFQFVYKFIEESEE